MTHVVCEPCVDCKNTVCVTVCPVECFHEEDRILYIDPDVCIDCGACVPVCPPEAIFPEADVPPEHQDDTALNRRFFEDGPGYAAGVELYESGRRK